MYFDHSLSHNTFLILPSTMAQFHSFSLLRKKQNKTKEQQWKEHTYSQVCAHTHTCTHPAKKPKHGIHFVLASDSSLWGLPWSVVDITSVIPQKKTDFLSPNSYQLQIASWLGMRHCAYFYLLVLGICLAWMFSDLRCVITVSVDSNGHHSSCVWEMLFLWTPPSLLTPMFFLPPLPHIHWSPEGMLW